MKINILEDLDLERVKIREALRKVGFNTTADHCFGIKAPFEVHPDSNNEEYLTRLSISMNPEFLFYGEYEGENRTGKYEEKCVPWIACEFGISVENEEGKNTKRVNDILMWLREKIKECEIKPFYDEDACFGYFTHFRYYKNMGAVYAKFYMNPDYQKGYWENHTLD